MKSHYYILIALQIIFASKSVLGQGYSLSRSYNYAADTDISKPGVLLYKNAWTGSTGFNGPNLYIPMVPGECYNLEGEWNNAISAIDTKMFCVILYDPKDCSGHRALRMERFGYAYNWLEYNYFGKVTSSLRLCEPPPIFDMPE